MYFYWYKVSERTHIQYCLYDTIILINFRVCHQHYPLCLFISMHALDRKIADFYLEKG